MEKESVSKRRERFEAEALGLMEPLHNLALRLTRSPDQAGDLLQDTYVRAYRAFDTFRPGTDFRAWVFTVMYSVFSNQLRKERRSPETVSVEDVEAVLEARSAEVGKDHAMAMLRERDPWAGGPEAAEALRNLPDDFRAAVVLVDLEELSYEEAARALDCPVGTVRSRLFRGRKILLSKLSGLAATLGYRPRGKE